MNKLMPLLLRLIVFGLVTTQTFQQTPAEGPLEVFLGEARMDMQQVFKNERFPNIVVTLDGTVLATWGNQHVRARRSEDGGKTWGSEITIAKPGFHGGGTTVDETTGDILAFVEDHHPPAPLTVYRSRDDGETWTPEKPTIRPDSNGNMPSMHMNEHGITLLRGANRGRLLRPSRYYGKKNDRSEWPNHYTNAIYSDDGGKSWQTSDPFPENGTGEATVAELSDGRIYYNSRVHWQERPKNTRRRSAMSDDGGESWKDWKVVDILPDGHQHRSYGCMGGLIRLPVAGKDILIFSNIDTPSAKRERGTVWASMDGGQTWPVKRLVYDGASAYSSLTAGRHGTPSEGWIFLHFEGGPDGGSQVARFNLSWLLAGEETGDGQLLKSMRDPKVERPPQYETDSIKVAAATADEPRIELSIQQAALYLDHGAVAWGEKKNCVSCHTNGTYMFIRPALTAKLGPPLQDVRNLFLEELASLSETSADKLRDSGTRPSQLIYIAAGLAAWDAHVRKELSPETDQALRLVFELQNQAGHWHSLSCWPPFESSAYQQAHMAAIAVSSAPGWLSSLGEDEEIRSRIDLLKTYLRESAIPHDYARVLQLWSSFRLDGILDAEQQQQTLTLIRDRQQDDGGWSLRHFAAPQEWGGGNRADKLRQESDFDSPPSDGHMTGLALLVLQQAGVLKSDEQLRNGLNWLRQNQRASGRWWTRSLNTDKQHYITYSGTAYSLLALQNASD